MFVNLRSGVRDVKLIRALEHANIGYRVVTAGAYAAVLPEKPFVIVP